MFKELLKNRLFIGAFVCFVLFVGGCLLYLQHLDRQLAAEKARTAEKIHEWEAKQQAAKPVDPPAVEKPEQGGHTHADGTWHAGAHEAQVDPSTARNRPQRNDAPRPGVSNDAPRLLPEDVFSAEYTAQVKAAVRTCVSLFHASEAEREAGGGHLAFALQSEAWNDA